MVLRTKARVRTAKNRKPSSTRWLQRQLNDPFVQAAREMGYRSRAAFKLLEIDDKFRLLKKGMKVADIGAAPGGWSEMAVKRVGKGNVAAIDLLDMKPIEGVEFLRADLDDPTAAEFMARSLGGNADIVLCDIAPNTTGIASLDHLKIMVLVDRAYDFATKILAKNGAFVAKVRQGGTEAELLKRIKSRFTGVNHFKPESSRKESAETYVVATGFRAEE
jgi:23S rRNA (uridine2552-2'-O)-methyltransferase